VADAKFDDLCLAIQPLAQEFLDRVNAQIAPAICKIIVTWRDADAQGAAYDQGLSSARAGQSPHNCMLDDGTPAARAFDFGIFEENGNYVINGDDPRYTNAGQIWKSLNQTWGGDFTHPDFDHCELANWRETNL
jgi:hypothetical protein